MENMYKSRYKYEIQISFTLVSNASGCNQFNSTAKQTGATIFIKLISEHSEFYTTQKKNYKVSSVLFFI